MKQIRIHAQGDPDVMQLVETPLPAVGAGQVRVQVKAIGVNFIDTYQRSGQYTMPLPFTPGQEAAGVIDALGAGVIGWQVGQRVGYGFTLGAYAEYAVVPAEALVPLPDNVTFEQAAGSLLQGMTAHYLTHDTFPLSSGHTALVHAAAGGTGQLIVQLAKRRGARVIATVSTAEKAALAHERGADEVIRYTEQDFETEVRRLTDGRGVDVIYDSVGKDTFEKGLNCLRPRGMMVLFGQSSGAIAPFNPQILNAKGSLFLTRPSLGHYLLTREELLQRSGAIFAGLGEGWLTLQIAQTFPLSAAAAAHRFLTGRGALGKILISP